MFEDKSYLNKDTILLYETYHYIRPGHFYIYRFKHYRFFRSIGNTKAVFCSLNPAHSWDKVNFSERELQTSLNSGQVKLIYGGI